MTTKHSAPHVLLAGLFHETHTFLEETTTRENFEIRRGHEILATAGDGSPMAAVVEFGTAAGWEMTPGIDMRAMPGGTVLNEVFETFWDEFKTTCQAALAKGLDGIFLVLHGAMVTDKLPDVEGELLRRIRQLPGTHNLPVCGVLDLHGNISAKMMQHSQGFVAYRCNPHTDAHAASARAARLLDQILREGQSPLVLHEPAGLLWAPTATGTGDDPMKTLEARAREIEETHNDVFNVNVFGGYAFADTPDTGVSFSVISFGDRAEAQAAIDQLKNWSLQNRHLADVVDLDPEKLLPEIKKHLEASETPVVLAEPADNIGGGAPGDGTSLLRFFLKNQLDGFVVVINDPAAVARLQTRKTGSDCLLEIGGQGSSLGEGPVEIAATLVNLTDGNFELEDRHSHLASMMGIQISMGPCAVLQHELGQILLTSHKTPPFDLGQLRSQGIIPEAAALIGVKAAVAHRQAYDPIAAAQYTVETPGPCSSNLKLFPYRHLS